MIAETAAATIAATGALAYAVRGKSASILAPSVWRGVKTRPSIALTFDDGPSPATMELLRLLERHNAKATFFQCGINVERHPEIARAVRIGGHEIGNHTYSHPRFDFKTPGFIRGEIMRAQSAIKEHAGARPTLFRAPYGVRWFGLRGAQKKAGLTGVMWTTIAMDWALQGDGAAGRVLNGASNGAIICLHDGREVKRDPDVRETIRALELALPELQSRGFSFETVSEILCPQPPRRSQFQTS